jgi:hypothetical protein
MIPTSKNDKVLVVHFIFHVFNAELRERRLHAVNGFIELSKGRSELRTGYPRCYDENDGELEYHLHSCSWSCGCEDYGGG